MEPHLWSERFPPTVSLEKDCQISGQHLTTMLPGLQELTVEKPVHETASDDLNSQSFRF